MRYVVKSVAFNADDPDQRAMLDHAEQRKNFSAYIKRLIWNDLKGNLTKGVQENPGN
jgi:hypothetical protein